ncbi:MaoC family dehydratase [Siculibacillus lacustris]|uniref:MaoC family dehydratase n=1 Tax=Siculibacillus lacustris TaxID=1549641 RepID=A0A4Q9VHV5_9HYPH|nr:MaoC family dehydratase [Siculibacillus lacustris]TBW34754.1 MaoC family dehydratase [Siculibacillus lacustris]
MMYLEDYRAGATLDLGRHTFSAEEIVDFARQFDPQPFHIDEEAGRASLFGGLAASGWHVACAWMRLWIDHQNAEMAAADARGDDVVVSGPSPGFEDMRWSKPVLAGHTLSYRSTVIATRPSGSRPGWGTLVSRNSATDEAGDEVFSFVVNVFVPRRPRAPKA